MPSEQEEQFLGSPSEIYVFAVGVLVAIYSFVACVLLIRSIAKDPEIKDKVINYPSIFSAVFYFISSIIFLCVVVYFDGNDNDNLEHDDSFVISLLLFIFFLILAKLAIYSQFFTRLYVFFKSSILALNRCTIVTFITLIIIQFITVIWAIVLVSVRYLGNEEYSSFYQQFTAVFVCLFVFDCSLSWLLVGLFTNKLFRTMMFKSRSEFFEKTERYLQASRAAQAAPDLDHKEETPSSEKALNAENGNANGSSVDLYSGDDEKNANRSSRVRTESNPAPNGKTHHAQRPSAILRERRPSFLIDIAYASIDMHDKRKLDMITRNFLLSAMSIITVQLVYASFIIVSILNRDDDFEFNQSIVLWVYGGVFYPSDVVLSCLSLYLNYKFAEDYYKCLCRCCHERCGNWMVRRASVKILRKHSIQLTKLDLDLEKSANVD